MIKYKSTYENQQVTVLKDKINTIIAVIVYPRFEQIQYLFVQAVQHWNIQNTINCSTGS